MTDNWLISYLVRLSVLMVTPCLCFAQTARIQPSQIYQGDIATLEVEYVNKIPSLYAIDISPLEVDFEVLEVKSKVNRVDLGDEVSNRMQWKIKITPRRYGELRIPSLTLGDRTTSEMWLQVKQPTMAQREAEKILLNIDAIPSRPYVGEQIEIKIRLRSNMPLTEEQLLEPEADNVASYRSGDESRYSEKIADETFEVLERSIVLIAQKTGKLDIKPAVFKGKIESRELVSSARAIYRNSESLSLLVREPAKAFSGRHWLPASQIELTQNWQGIGEQLQLGDSVSRQITIRALGLPAEALPDDLLLVESEQFKVYADQSKRSQDFQGKDLEGKLTQSFEIVLTGSGVIDLPELVLPWWDIDEELEKQVVLPGKRLEVVTPIASPNQAQNESRIGDRIPFLWGSLVVTGIIVGLCFYIGRRTCSRYIRRFQQLRQLKKVCFSNDAVTARQVILSWANLQWPGEKIIGLHQVVCRVDMADVSTELSQLNMALYSSTGSEWRGERLYNLLSQYQRKTQYLSCIDSERLPALYPPGY